MDLPAYFVFQKQKSICLYIKQILLDVWEPRYSQMGDWDNPLSFNFSFSVSVCFPNFSLGSHWSVLTTDVQSQ